MIDWLDFHIEVNHPTLKSGSVMWFDEEGEMKKTIDTGFYTDDSSCSKVKIQSDSAKAFYSEASLQLLRNNKIFVDNGTTSSLLSFKGNPAKFLQLHNVIGIDCLKTLALSCFDKCIEQIKLPHDVINICRNKLANLDFRVTRCDITYMFDLGTDEDVKDYLYQMPRTVRARGGRTENTINTFYVGKNSTLWSLKFYNKYTELKSPKKSHRLHDSLKETGLLEFSKGKLRVELVLRKKQLDRLKMVSAKELQHNVKKLFKQHLDKINMTEQKIKKDKISDLSNKIITTYHLWEKGKNPRCFLSDSTFYRHRRELLKAGIDIALVNEEINEEIYSIIPIHTFLEPNFVSFCSIPKEIKSLCIQ